MDAQDGVGRASTVVLSAYGELVLRCKSRETAEALFSSNFLYLVTLQSSISHYVSEKCFSCCVSEVFIIMWAFKVGVISKQNVFPLLDLNRSSS